jgi:hypothetical protein
MEWESTEVKMARRECQDVVTHTAWSNCTCAVTEIGKINYIEYKARLIISYVLH